GGGGVARGSRRGTGPPVPAPRSGVLRGRLRGPADAPGLRGRPRLPGAEPRRVRRHPRRPDGPAPREPVAEPVLRGVLPPGPEPAEPGRRPGPAGLAGRLPPPGAAPFDPRGGG